MQPGSFASLQEHYRQQVKEHPEDPLTLDLAANALIGMDTAEAIRLLEAAKEEAPQFVWPDLDLAGIYTSGKFADKQKFTDHLTAFWTACPGATDSMARWLLVKDMGLQAKVASALRIQLEKESDPDQLRNYEFLWGLEFRTHPPQEYDAIRKQVATDLKRLEGLQPKPDAEWMTFLIGGYKQSGASTETVTAMEDGLLQQYPHSDEAFEIVEKRWDKAHKEPEDQKNTAAWAAYHRIRAEAVRGWMQQFPDVDYLQRYAGFQLAESNDSLTEKNGVAEVDVYLAMGEKYDSPDWWQTRYLAADFLLDRNWQPQRALELLQQVQTLQAKSAEKDAKRDNLSADEIKNKEEDERMVRNLVLRAALLAKRPDAAEPLKASIETDPPKERKDESDYWLNRARLEVLENRKEDALTYYQRALQTRLKPPSYWQGKLTDTLMDESQTLWMEMGGTQTAWGVWTKPPAENAADASEAQWEKATQTLPAFELADLSGKTWRLTDLKGKVVLINLWATWCGPCNAELPELEKLYLKIKDRSDIQILTFNIDEHVGLVAPYLKGYTFPVLPAYSLVVTLLNGFTIPENWVVDPKGAWLWTQIGFGADDAWVQDMIQKLEMTKSGS